MAKAKKATEAPVQAAPMSMEEICAELLATNSTVAPRPEWTKKAATHATFKGTLTFGVMTIGVRAFTATEDDKVSFKSLHSCGSTLKMGDMRCPVCECNVPKSEIQKGYEVAKGEYIVVTPEEIENCKISSTDKMIVKQFAAASDFDPIYFESTGFLCPEEGSPTYAKVFALLRSGMVTTNKVAVVEYNRNDRNRTAILRPITLSDGKEGIAISYLLQENEVRTSENWKPVLLTEKETKLAADLVNGLTEDFDITEHYDGYTANLRAMLEAKINKTEAPTFAKQAAAPVATEFDILASLEASLEVASTVKKARSAKKAA